MTIDSDGFESIANLLEAAVSESEQVFRAASIHSKERSDRRGGRGEYPQWAFEFSRVWELDLETARVRLQLTYHAAIAGSKSSDVKIWCCAEQFRPGQVSRVRETSEDTVDVTDITAVGLGAFVIQRMRQAAAQVQQKLQ